MSILDFSIYINSCPTVEIFALPTHGRDLKKELTRLKKEHKGVKRTPTSQLPRPAAGRKG